MNDVKSIFSAALELDSPEARGAYLDQACGENRELRAQVEGLLAALDKAGSFMQQPAAPPGGCVASDPEQTVDTPPIQERPGTLIGPYKLMEQIGEGGFGLVFVAEQQHPVRRQVALKIIKPGMDTRDVVARFEAERQALALMDHPNIARVFDAGATQSGRPYFVMELVRGVPITQYCDEQHVSVRERLELFASVCQAIQHAHQKGIIHRDVKPSNVLVTLHDGRPVVKVIDFGVAKALNQQLAQHTIYTRFSQMIGTPLYMSPEQAAMSGLDIDTRSDIYSLGVLLYELLTGTPPIERERLAQAAFDELRRIIREEEPPKPSTRLTQSGDSLASIAALRRTEPGRLSKLLRGELDWIVMKALEKDRTRRYDTAGGFAADIQRYLSDQPVEACPPSLAYRVRKFVRRNRAAAVSAALIATALLLGTALSTWQAIRASTAQRQAIENQKQAMAAAEAEKRAHDQEAEERKRAERAEIQAQEERDNAVMERKRADEQRQVAEAERRKAQDESRQKERHLYAAHIALADQAIQQAFLPTAVDLLDRQHGAQADELRSFEWRYLRRKCQCRLEINAACGTVTSLAFSPDGKQVYSKGADYNLHAWIAATGKSLWTVRATSRRGADDLIVDQESGNVLSREMIGAALLNAANGDRLATYKGDADGESLVVAGDGRAVLAPAGEGKWQMVRIADGSKQRELTLPGEFAWSFSPGGKHLAGISHRVKKFAIFNLESDELRQFDLEDPGYWTFSIALSPDARRAVVGTWAYDVHWHKLERTANGMSYAGHSESGGSIPVKSCLLVDPSLGQILGRIEGHHGGLSAVAFSPDGKLLATASKDAAVRLWDANTARPLGVAGWHAEGATAVAFSPNGQELASGGHDGKIKLWPLPLDRAERAQLGPKARVLDLAVSSDGKTIAAVGRKTNSDVPGMVWLIDAQSGQIKHSFEQERVVTSVDFHPHKPLIAFVMERIVTLWDNDRKEVVDKLELLDWAPGCARFLQDGNQLLAAGSERWVLWDIATRKKVREVNYKADWYQWPVVSRRQDRLLFADWNYAQGQLFSLPDGQPQPTLGVRWDSPIGGGNGGGIGDHVAKGAFSDDGKLIAVPARNSIMGAAGKVDLVELESGKVVASLAGQSVDFLCVAFSPDGRTVATGMRDGTILFWDPITGEQRLRLEAHRGQVSSLVFTRDGRLLLSGAWDGTVGLHRISD